MYILDLLLFRMIWSVDYLAAVSLGVEKMKLEKSVDLPGQVPKKGLLDDSAMPAFSTNRKTDIHIKSMGQWEPEIKAPAREPA